MNPFVFNSSLVSAIFFWDGSPACSGCFFFFFLLFLGFLCDLFVCLLAANIVSVLVINKKKIFMVSYGTSCWVLDF